MIILQIQYFGVQARSRARQPKDLYHFQNNSIEAECTIEADVCACVLENESFKLAYEKGKF